MSKPKAYSPEHGYKLQILCRDTFHSNEYEHCDYATSYKELKFLVAEYRMAYGAGWQFISILLPQKYWPLTVPTGVEATPSLPQMV